MRLHVVTLCTVVLCAVVKSVRKSALRRHDVKPTRSSSKATATFKRNRHDGRHRSAKKQRVSSSSDSSSDSASSPFPSTLAEEAARQLLHAMRVNSDKGDEGDNDDVDDDEGVLSP